MAVNTTAPAGLGGRVAAGAEGSNFQSILQSPSFQELVTTRSKFGWTLSILMLFIYLGFILLVAFDKALLAQKIGGGTTSLGIVLGLGVIISAFVLTGIYVVRANGRFDSLNDQVKREIGL
jgi:uncharacterized membrane protein (DUF485 family)